MKSYKTLWLALIFGLAATAYAQEGADCNPVQNLSAEGFDQTVSLKWEAPEAYIPNEQIGYSGDYDGWIGTTPPFTVAVRWSPEQLTELDIKETAVLTAIEIAPYFGYDDYYFAIIVWQGGSSISDAGEELLYQEVNTPLYGEKWNTVILDNPIPIDISKELRIGYYHERKDIPAGHYAGVDDKQAVATGYCDLFLLDDLWSTVYFMSSGSLLVNLCIRGIITYEEVPLDQYNIYKNPN